MPHLSDVTRRKLKYLPSGNHQAPHGGASLACWNWALTGFGGTQNNPDQLFNFVSLNIAYNAMGVAWYTIPANQNQLAQLQLQWAPYSNAWADTAARRDTLHQINTELVKLAISLNGLAWSPTRTPYQVVMHYDPKNNDNSLNGPNYSHWWLQIDGGGANNHADGLEVFPGNANLNIRRPEYNNQNNCKVYVQQLHLDHVTRIDNVLATIIANQHPTLVAHGPWTDTYNCSLCNKSLALGISRHHCRCCGRSVCADCSPTTRAMLLGGTLPVGKRGAAPAVGPYRVCLYC